MGFAVGVEVAAGRFATTFEVSPLMDVKSV